MFDFQLQLAARNGWLEFFKHRVRQMLHVDLGKVELQSSGAGELEDVVDELSHAAGVVTHHVEQALAFVVQFVSVVFQQNMGKPIDGTQRRAQVVRDGIGKSFQLLVRLFQLRSTLVYPPFQVAVEFIDLVLGLLEPGDVEVDASHAQRPALRISHELAVGLEIVGAAIGPHHAEFGIVFSLAALRLFRDFVARSAVVGMYALQPGLIGAGKLLSFDAIEFIHPVVPDQFVLLQIPVPYPQARGASGQGVAFVHQAQALFRTLALDAGTQHHDAKGHVARQFFQQSHLFRRKGIGCGGINIEGTECFCAFVLERQRNGGTIAALQSGLAPGGGIGVGAEILNAGTLSAAEGDSAGTAPAFRVGPGQASLFEKAALDSGPGNGTDGFGCVVFRITHPDHAIASIVADNAADIVKQRLLVLGPHQGLVAVADGAQFTVQTPQRFLVPLVFGDVAQDADRMPAIIEFERRDR